MAVVVRAKAHALARGGVIPRDDVADAEQDLTLAVLAARPRFDPGRGTPEAFAATVVRHAVAKLTHGRFAAKRHPARVVGAASGQTRLTLAGHTGAVCGAVFSPDGRRVATRDDGGTVRLWDGATGGLVRSHPGPPGGSTCGVCFSPGGGRYAAVRGAAGVAVWDAASGDRVWEAASGGRLSHVGFTADERLVVARGAGGVFAWDAGGGHPAYAARPPGGPLVSHALSPDGRWLATATPSAVQLWDAPTGRPLSECKGHDEERSGFSLAFLADGSRLVGAGSTGRSCLWDTLTGQVTLQFPATSLPLRLAAASPDGRRIAIAGDTTLWIREARPR